MKTAIQILENEIDNYQKESGNDSIDISLLKQGLNGIYGCLLKQQIIKAYDDAFQYVVGGGFVAKTGEQYFEEVYGTTNKETLK